MLKKKRQWMRGVCLAGLLLLAMQTPVWSQSSQGIVAVVNNSVITNYDLEQRIGLALVTSGLARTPEIEAALRPQALNRLIDDRLKLQEAGRFNVSVSENELRNALSQLAQDNNMTFTDIEQLLSNNGVTLESLRDQLVADLVWNRLLEGLFVPQVSLSLEQVEREHARAVEELAQTQYLVSEIVLPFDSAAQESVARDNAYRLLEPLRSGTPFEPLAQQFSQSPTSANGGRIGWVVAGQLDGELDRMLPSLSRGEISDPIRTNNAYYILRLLDKREGGGNVLLLDTINLARAFLPLAADASGDVLTQADLHVQRFYADFTDCAEGVALAESIGAEFQLLDGMTDTQLPAGLREAVSGRDVGDLLPPRRTSDGVEIIAICGREQHRAAPISIADVERGLVEREVELMGRRHLRDLRREAVIELR